MRGNALIAFDSATFGDSNFAINAEPDTVFDQTPEVGVLPAGVFADIPNLETLSLSGNKLAALPDGGFEVLPSLRLLDLSGNALRALPAHFCKGMDSLRTLLLSNNVIDTLPEGVFADVPGLVKLDLSYNQLNFTVDQAPAPAPAPAPTPALPPRVVKPGICADESDEALAGVAGSVFTGMRDLATLLLSHNTIGALPQGVFADLPSLTKLDLSGNVITALPAIAFKNDTSPKARNTSISTLLLSANIIETLPLGAFEYMPDLETLDLSGNVLRDLPAEPFASVSALATLSLSNNTIDALPEGIFDATPMLSELDVSANSLSELPSDVFNGTRALKTLDLSGNALRSLPPNFCNGTNSLRTLLLSNNVIDTLSEGVFAGVPSLVTLDLSYNQLAFVESVFTGMHDLATLLLSHNIIGALPEGAFVDLPSLDKLDLSGNVITALPGIAFKRNSAITTLLLSANIIETLPLGAFEYMPDLETLDLSGNVLRDLPAEPFASVSALATLSLSNNTIDALPEGIFDATPMLSELDVSANSLSELPSDVFNGTRALKTFLLANNNIQALPDGIFDDTPNLRLLNLSGNALDLDAFPKGVFGETLASLETLSLSANNLTFLALEGKPFVNLTRMTGLWLDDNLLSALPNETFHGLGYLVELHLQKNSLAGPQPEGVLTPLGSLTTLNLGDSGSGTLCFKKLPPGPIKSWMVGVQLCNQQRALLAVCGQCRFYVNLLDASEGRLERDRPLGECPNGNCCGVDCTRLELNGSDVRSLPQGVLSGMRTLKYLDLSNNNLSQPDSFAGFYQDSDLGGLTELRLAHTIISELPDRLFESMSSLASLDLSQNSISTLSEGLFADVSATLAVLDLSYNQLNFTKSPSLPFADLRVLKSLHLGGNSLHTLPDGLFDSQSSLRALDLSGNELVSLNTTPTLPFTSLPYLRTLNLGNNSLPGLPPKLFDTQCRLEELFLFENDIVTLPEGLLNHTRELTVLDISYNELTNATADALPFAERQTLQSLKLGNNNFSGTLPYNLFKDLTALTTLELQGNDLSGEQPWFLLEHLSSLTSLNLDSNNATMCILKLPEATAGDLAH
eukprot:PRCOL_00007244-RA